MSTYNNNKYFHSNMKYFDIFYKVSTFTIYIHLLDIHKCFKKCFYIQRKKPKKKHKKNDISITLETVTIRIGKLM